jgi:CubicO group peptidase (beta-lactamase class C family)
MVNGAGVLKQVSQWPVTAAAAAVVGPEGVRASYGPLDRVFAWASVTKLLTALAALDAVGRGLLDLDDPAGPPGSTVRHLLAHASGLALDGGIVLSRPGRRRVYSNSGIELVSEQVAMHTGKGFEAVLEDEVLRPLGLRGTVLHGSPARGASGPLSDLATLAQELLAPSLLDTDLLAEATTTAFPGLSGVVPGFGRQEGCDWGLGFEVRGSKSPHWTGRDNSPRTFGHFGRSGSFLWVDPEAGLACVALADREFDEWARQAWPRLSDDVLAAAR